MKRVAVLLALAACAAEKASPPPQHVEMPSQPDAAAPEPVATREPEPPPSPPAPVDAGAPSEAYLLARDPRIKTMRVTNATSDEMARIESRLGKTPKASPARLALLHQSMDLSAALARGLGAKDGTARMLRGLMLTQSSMRAATLIKDYPTYAELDAVLYYRGYADELRGDPGSARSSYEELVRRFPKSKFVAAAQFGLGEIAFAEAEKKNDAAKYETAKKAYEEVLKYPDAACFPFAREKVAVITAR